VSDPEWLYLWGLAGQVETTVAQSLYHSALVAVALQKLENSNYELFT
jgi:hypothetical protein